MFCPMRGIVAAMVVVTMTAALAAQDKLDEASSPQKDILALLTRVETTFASGDAKGLAACWTPSGEFAGPGGARTEGRENIEKLFQEGFAMHKDCKLALHLQHFRLVNDSLALVDAVADVKPAVPTCGTELTSFVIVKQNGQWLIESGRESTIHLPPQANSLKDIQWLAGSWSSPVSPGGITLSASCDWTMNHAFLIRKFKVEGKEAFLHGGTEVIGWDPRTQSVRSWVFDSDGGFGENTWVHDGNRWLTKFTGTLADGSAVSATHIITKIDDDTVAIQSKDRTMNGAAQPDIAEITLKRQVVAAALPQLPSKTDEIPKTPGIGKGAP